VSVTFWGLVRDYKERAERTRRSREEAMTTSSTMRSTVLTRKCQRIASLAHEKESEVTSTIREIRQLREEQARREQEFAVMLQQRDEELQRLKKTNKSFH